jgi:hypothetical protein
MNLLAVQVVFNLTFWSCILIFFSYLLLVCRVCSFCNVFYPKLCKYLTILLIHAAYLVHINSNLCACYDFITSDSWKTIVRKDSSLLECDAVSLGEWFLILEGSWCLEDEGTFILNPQQHCCGNLKFKIVRNILFCGINLKYCTSEQSLCVKCL